MGTRARILVTGGPGFIGSHVGDELIHRGQLVTVIDDLSSGALDSVNKHANLIVASIADLNLVHDTIAESDACVHLAAMASIERCNAAWAKSHQVNQSAFVGLLEAVARRPGGPIPVV
jgi:UDP-glucose 4-epimerase